VSTDAPFFADIADAPDGASVFWCETPDKTRIRGAIWRGGSRGTILLLTGRTEYIEKYGPVVARLTAMGFCVLTLDWRGQGLSDRPPSDATLGHVEAFKDYQSDLNTVLAAPEAADLPGPRVLFGHSMGGCIGLRALLNHPDITAGVFSGPMWGIRMSSLSRFGAKFLIGLTGLLGTDTRHTPGTGKGFYAQETGFDENLLTSDRDQLDRLRAHLTAHPELGLGGPSIKWLSAAFEEMAALQAGPKPTIPVLTFLGSDEKIVDPETTKSYMPKLAHGELVICEGARHEIWMESDAIQGPVWDKITAFLATHAPV